MQNKNALEFQRFDQEDDDMSIINKLIDQMGYSKYHFFITIIAATILAVDGAQSILLAILLSFLNLKENISEYDLAIINTIESIGYAFATIFVNIITQSISNRRTIQIFTILSLVFTGLCLSTFNYYFICANRFSFGFCIGCIDLLVYIMLIENTPTRIRGFLSSIIFVFNPLGALLVSLYGYYELDDGKTHGDFYFLVLCPFFILLVLAISVFFFQETPRTLLTQNKLEEGINTIQKINTFNDNENDPDTRRQREKMINQMKEKLRRKKTIVENNGKQSSVDIKDSNYVNADKVSVSSEEFRNLNFSNKFLRLFNINYRKYTILIWIIIILSSFTSNGIFFMLPTTAPDLDKETFKGVILSVFIEIPSNVLTSLLIENSKIGRLRAMKIGLLGALIASSFHFIYLRPVLYIDCILKFFINIPVSVITVYGSELYDSKIRIFGTSTINFWKRLSFIMSPLAVAFLDNKFGPSSGYLLFTPSSFLALFIAFFLDIETRGVPLDEFGKS